MKSRRRLSSRCINFSVALVVVLLAHAALLLAWQTDAPVIRLADQAASVPSVMVTAVIVTATSSRKPVLAKPNAVSLSEVLSPQAALDKALPASLPAPLQIPASTRLYYTLTKGGSSANALLSWHIKPSAAGQMPAYELTLEVSAGPLTLLKQTSIGELTQHGLAPVRYSDKRLRKSEQATHFDAAAGTVTFSNNRPQAAWTVGLQDRLSVLVQLAALAQGNAASAAALHWQVGELLELPVASTDEQERWQWEVQAHGAQDAANTIKLLRRPRHAFDASIELWLSPSIGYLPSRIRQTDSSGVTDQLLVQAESL